MFDISLDNHMRVTVEASGEVALINEAGDPIATGMLGLPEGAPGPTYAPGNIIVEDGNENEPCTVKSICMVDNRLVYVCARNADGFLTCIREEDSADYTEVR